VFTGVKSAMFKEWFNLKRTASLETILKLCYVCEVTPFQVMRGEKSSLVEAFQCGTTSRSPLRRRVIPKVDQEYCLAFIRAVLDGHYSLKISLSLSEDKFVAISTPRAKGVVSDERLC
jgi:hypothetical protein